MSTTTSHPSTVGQRWTSAVGLLLAAAVVAAVAWAAGAIATRAGEDPPTALDRVAAEPAVLTPEVVAPAYSARADEAALLQAAAWRTYAAGEHAAHLQIYAAALSTLTPEIVAPAYSARFDDATRLRNGLTPATAGSAR